jgi:phage protein D
LTGHARLWLTFDDIDTHHGRLALVAEVSSVPGDFGVRTGKSREGEIEARTSNGARVLEAAAAGAAAGAAPGVAARNAKAAATGAAAGAAAAFVTASSGVGQEIDLTKGTKLDLILDRPLYLNR